MIKLLCIISLLILVMINNSVFANYHNFSYKLNYSLRNYLFIGDKLSSLNIKTYGANYTESNLKIDLNYKYDNISIVSNLRVINKHLKDTKSLINRIYLDELYISVKTSPTWFVHIGKKRLSNGVSLGYNPTDYFIYDTFIDRHLSFVQSKNEREGVNIIQITKLFNNYTIDLACSKGCFIRYSQNLINLEVDYNISAYKHNDYTAGGINLSANLNENTTIYIENSISNHRNRILAKLNNIGQIEISNINKGLYIQSVFGLNYTHSSNIGVILEYQYNSKGYSKQELQDIINAFSFTKQIEKIQTIYSQTWIRKNRIMLSLDYKFNNSFDLSIQNIYDLNGTSSFNRLTVNYNINENLYANFSFEKFILFNKIHKNYSDYGNSNVKKGFFFSVNYII